MAINAAVGFAINALQHGASEFDAMRTLRFQYPGISAEDAELIVHRAASSLADPAVSTGDTSEVLPNGGTVAIHGISSITGSIFGTVQIGVGKGQSIQDAINRWLAYATTGRNAGKYDQRLVEAIRSGDLDIEWVVRN